MLWVGIDECAGESPKGENGELPPLLMLGDGRPRLSMLRLRGTNVCDDVSPNGPDDVGGEKKRGGGEIMKLLNGGGELDGAREWLM